MSFVNSQKFRFCSIQYETAGRFYPGEKYDEIYALKETF